MQAGWTRQTFEMALLALLAAGGCSSLARRDAALADYEATRRQIEGGSRGVQPAAYEASGAEDSFAESLNGTVRQLTGNGPDPKQAKVLKSEGEALYQQAIQARQQNSDVGHAPLFLAAASKLGSAAKKWPSSTVEQDALFLQAEANFFADRYPKAQDTYERLLEKYPNCRYLDRVQPRRFSIAQYWLTLHRESPQNLLSFNVTDRTRPGRDTFGEAIRTFDRIRLDDPTGKLADDASLAIGNAYFNRGDFMRADENYEDLRKTFPSSEHQFRAHFLGLKCKLLNYQGPDYSGLALVEAEELLSQIRKQFPVEAEQEREYLAKAAAEIRYRLAEREWHSGQHYDRRAEFGAARFHYRTLLAEYGDTPFTPRAEARLASIGDRPNDPPQRFAWVAKLFPDREPEKPLLQSGSIVR